MKAVQYDSYGPPDVLKIRDVKTPTVQPGHVVVRTVASSVNAADVLIRSGKLRLLSGGAFPRGTGFDFTGEIVEVAKDVAGFSVGDAVWGFVNTGVRQGPIATTAEYVQAPASAVARRPRSLDPIQAAALPGAAGAALAVLRLDARVRKGERVLVRGASGGVGIAAVQIAHAMGAHVTALVRDNQIERVRAIGAHEAFDYRATTPEALGRFDVILDPVAKNLRGFRRLLNPGGRMLTTTIGGIREVPYWLFSVVFGRSRVRFVSRPPPGAILAELTQLVEAGTIAPVVERVYAMDEIAEAHRSLEAGGGFGKRVIRS